MKIGKISKQKLYTAKEYLNMDKYKITGKLKHDLEKIDALNKKNIERKKKGKIIKLNIVTKQLKYINTNIKIEKKADYHNVELKQKTICWLTQRSYGVSLSYREDGKTITKRIIVKDDIEKIYNEIIKEGKMMDYKYLLVDGPYLAHRSYLAPYRLYTDTGVDGTMIHSFMRTLNSLRKKYHPEKIIITWESHGTESWRRKEYPKYKPSSKKHTKVFWNNIKDVQTLLHLLEDRKSVV